jgi:predicted  nucleic acid-binding Zn-ribbon protein
MTDDELKDYLGALFAAQDAAIDARFKAQEQFIYARYRETDAKLDRALAELTDIKARATDLEIHMGLVVGGVGRVNDRLDGVDKRLAHIERRLGLVDEPIP